MGKYGCTNGCVFNKPIKLKEMLESYAFRCEAYGTYMKKTDVKKRCKQYKSGYIIQSVEAFLDED